MSGVSSDEQARLARFIDKLLVPAFPQASNRTHAGIGRALLGCRYPWERHERLFLRAMVCAPTASEEDFARLLMLLDRAKESAR